jgi:RNA polymerase sigma-70 factor (ECF subfamily)
MAGTPTRSDPHVRASNPVPLSDVDRTLLNYCFRKRPFAWESFVDRYLMLVVFVVKHTARSRRIALPEHDEFDLVSDVFLTLIRDDFAILRRFRGQSSLATYLTVVARRVVVRKLVRVSRHAQRPAGMLETPGPAPDIDFPETSTDELNALLRQLDANEASLVRMYHLEKKSIEQISQATGMGAASVGAMLESARDKMRRLDVNQGA